MFCYFNLILYLGQKSAADALNNSSITGLPGAARHQLGFQIDRFMQNQKFCGFASLRGSTLLIVYLAYLLLWLKEKIIIYIKNYFIIFVVFSQDIGLRS